MLAQRIQTLLQRHPYWGPKRIAEELKTTSAVIRTVANREQIAFMDRREVEDWVDDRLRDA